MGQLLVDVDIVLITFNQHELEQTLECFCPNARAEQKEGHNRIYYPLGQHNGNNLVLIHSKQATIEAMKTAQWGIDVFQPRAIIAVGIAFGMDSKKQHIGDVLISEFIVPYELARVNQNGSITPRGPRPVASKHLTDWFHQVDAYLNKEDGVEYAKRNFGGIFSGDKLIDNQDYRDQLAQMDSTAIGGEMEGTGLFHACEASKTDWIIVKAICDFADGNKGKNKEANQIAAAKNAASLVKAALEFGHIYPENKLTKANKVSAKSLTNNFHHYKARCSDLSDIHELALVKDARALPTSLRKEQEALQEQESVQGIPVVARLMDWATQAQDKSVFALLGEYGMGKTISCQLFDKHLRAQLQQSNKIPVPLYFDLRHVTSKTLTNSFHFADIIKDCIRLGWINSENQGAFTTSDIERWANQSGVVLIFDGLDEVLVKLPETDGRLFTDQLYKYQAELASKTQQPVKMLLTCRSQYFKTLDRQKDHFTGQERGGVNPDEIEAMVMLPLSEEQITNYLRHALPGIEPETIIDMVKSVHDLHDLSKRPFTLKLVGEFFPALEEDRKAGKAISGVSLYRRVVDRWLNRDNGKHQIKSDHKLQLAAHLAALLWEQKQTSLPASEIEDWFMGWLADNPKIAFRYQGISPDILEEDLRTATFLCREDDEQGSRFRFSHTSLQEFFLASYLLQAIKDNKPEHWAMAKPSQETLVFLAQLLAEPDNKPLLNPLSEWRKAYRQHASENLLHYALVAYGLGFSVPTLNGIQLPGANLAELNFQGKAANQLTLERANFTQANLRRAKFSHINLTGAQFSGAILDNAEFDQCRLEKSDWSAAQMAATRLFRCSLDDANFATANVHRSRLLKCQALPELVKNNQQWLVDLPELSNTNKYYSTAGHNSEVTSCAISTDVRYLVSSSDDNSLRQWDLSTGECLREFIGHSSGVSSCVLSADGRYMVSGSWDKSLRQWDLSTGECLREFIDHQSSVTCCALSADGCYLVSGSNDRVLRQWDLSTGVCLHEFIGHTSAITSCTLSVDGRYLVSGSHDKTLRQWDMRTGECLREFIGHSERISSCTLSADGRYLVSGSFDKTLRQWDMSTGKCLREFMKHSHFVTSCALSADGRYLVSGSGDKTLLQWDLSTGECLREFISHSYITSCTLSRDGRYLVSGSGDKTIWLWDLNGGECLREFIGYSSYVTSCALSKDSCYLVLGSSDKNLRLWDLSKGNFLREFIGHSSSVSSCALSTDGRYLVSGSFDRTLRLWELSSGECLREFIGHRAMVSSCVLSADGRYLVSGSWDNSLRQWDLSSGECLREFIGHSSSVNCLALSADDRYLVSGSWDNSLRLWNMNTGEYLREFIGHGDWISSCALSADGKYLISGSHDRTLRQWDIRTGECLREFISHSSSVNCLALNADGRYLVSGAGDGSMRQWDLSTGGCVREFIGHTSGVTSCTLSNDGRHIISSSTDSTVRIWSLETGRVLKVIFHAPESNYLTVDGNQQKIIAKSEYAWRYFNGYFINEQGEPDSFPVI